MNSAVDRLAWQNVIFAERLNRFQLMKLGSRIADDAPKLLVLRNHVFETAAVALPPFLAFAGLQLRPAYSDYDDSVPLPQEPAAAVLVWMDFHRLDGLDDESLTDWLLARLTRVRGRCSGALIVANAPDRDARSERLNNLLERWAEETADAAVLRLDAIARDLGDGFFDDGRAEVAGTRYSDQAMLRAARALGLELLPSFLGQPVKAIAVDLDNTLYDGVLGEEGPRGVTLTDGHQALQRELAGWAAKGVLIAIVSRNEVADVQQLFNERPDFPLRPEMVASWQVGWEDKSVSVAAAAAEFNIAPDGVLFIDDNGGELIEVAHAHPGLRLLYAGSGPEHTAAALRAYPALPRGPIFAGRADDVRANRERAAIASASLDEEAYLEALKPVLTFALNAQGDRKRLAELSAKTNQFNLALKRFDERAVDQRLTDPDGAVVHVRLADRLADSGSIAAIFMRRAAEMLVVEELCISCRALGRRLESLIVGEAVRGAAEALGVRRVVFDYVTGPRNAPALAWLQDLIGRPLPQREGQAEIGSIDLLAETPSVVRLMWAGE